MNKLGLVNDKKKNPNEFRDAKYGAHKARTEVRNHGDMFGGDDQVEKTNIGKKDLEVAYQEKDWEAIDDLDDLKTAWNRNAVACNKLVAEHRELLQEIEAI